MTRAHFFLMNKHYFINDVQVTSTADIASLTAGLTPAKTSTVKTETSTQAPAQKVESVTEQALDDMLADLG